MSGLGAPCAPRGARQAHPAEARNCGPPREQRPSTAIAIGQDAAALSWTDNRLRNQLRVLEAINVLESEPFDSNQKSYTRHYDEGLLVISHLPRLGVTVMQLHRLEHSAVLVASGKEQAPAQLRFISVQT
jgi:hypothetical protein